MNPKRFADYRWTDVLRIAAGVIMLIWGLFGLVLPVLQGILFLVIAFFLLAPYSRHMRRILAWSRMRFPDLHRRARQFKTRMLRWFNGD